MTFLDRAMTVTAFTQPFQRLQHAFQILNLSTDVKDLIFSDHFDICF